MAEQKTKAEAYFEKEYGPDHIKKVVELKDMKSLFELMDEFAENECDCWIKMDDLGEQLAGL